MYGLEKLEAQKEESSTRNRWLAAVVAAAVIPALIVGVVAWQSFPTSEIPRYLDGKIIHIR